MDNNERDFFLKLLSECEVELDAWKDFKPDAAGNTTWLLIKLRAVIESHQKNSLTFENEQNENPANGIS